MRHYETLESCHRSVETQRKFVDQYSEPWVTDIHTRIEPDNDRHLSIDLRLSGWGSSSNWNTPQ